MSRLLRLGGEKAMEITKENTSVEQVSAKVVKRSTWSR